jgi:hypothetical protein
MEKMYVADFKCAPWHSREGLANGTTSKAQFLGVFDDGCQTGWNFSADCRCAVRHSMRLEMISPNAESRH